MVDRHALSSRLDALESYLTELRAFRSVSREDFVREPSLHHLAERFLAIDHGRTYDAIQDDLGDLEQFAAAMAPLLGP